MTVQFNSQQPVDDFGLPQSDLKFSANLAANVDTPLTVPGLGTGTASDISVPRYKAIMKTLPGVGQVWVAVNAVAEVPAGPGFAPTTSELIEPLKLGREVKAGDVIHFISPNAGTPVSVVLYAIN